VQSGIYVSYSGQVALERRLETIANNIANAGTAGYRAEELKFDTVLSNLTNNPTAFSSAGKSYLSQKSGGFKQTGNPLDVAIRGQGWMAIQTTGGTAYTRDGRMTMKATGELVTLNGNAVLDSGGASIAVNPSAGEPNIDHEGNITQSGTSVGKIGLYTLDVSNGYLRSENTAIIPVLPATAIEIFTTDGFAQGYVEESNVNSVTEMTNLIMVTRSFDGLQTSIDESESSLKKAIQVLGGG
jgi:flagellar basal-body rod protein FlgF